MWNQKKINLTKTQILFIVFLSLFATSLVAWLVNLEVAVQIFFPGFILISDLLPVRVHDRLAWLSADLSTISTLVPVLLFLFPCMQSWRVMQAGNNMLIRRAIPVIHINKFSLSFGHVVWQARFMVYLLVWM